jgi:NADH-quinone oxidoreductase subunit A
MLAPYVPIVILAGLALGLGGLVLAISAFVGPRDPTAVKRAPYESGLVPVGPARRRVPVRFYLVATLFILFDVEVIYLFPWALRFRALCRPAPAGIGATALASVAVFGGVLLVGLVYVWRKGALEWE